MKSVMKVLHVEDDNTKAASVRRILERIASRDGWALEVDRAATLADVPSDVTGYDLAVVDWCFPCNGDAERVTNGLGASVSERTCKAGVPTVIVSGGLRPPSYVHPAIWCDDWLYGITLAVEQVRTMRRPMSKRLAALGFQIRQLGGNCRAWGRPVPSEPDTWEQVHSAGDLSLPDEAGEEVVVGVIGRDDEDYRSAQLYADLTECVEALEAAAC